jgi:CDGSH-type Zn-finger protein
MTKPVIAEKTPAVMELEAGTYYWCRCGRSANQPMCDGSHAGTEFSPLKLELTEAQRVALCQCKHTDKEPYCDGTHARLE